MEYSLQRHTAATRRYVELIAPVLRDLAIRDTRQPGLARALVGLCVVDGIGISSEPEAVASYLAAMREDESASAALDTATAPFYDAYVGLWFGRNPEQTTLSSGAAREANRAVLHLGEEQVRLLGSGAIGTEAYRLAVVRHEILRGAYPTLLHAEFPSAESLASYDPRRATKR